MNQAAKKNRHFPLSKTIKSFFCFAALALSFAAGAQDAVQYPNLPVKIIAPFAPGGPTDGIARKLANGLTIVTGKPFIVENKPGAQAILGTVFVKDSKPDGYTLLLNETTGVFAINPAITNPPPFDSNKDFTPISLIASGPIFLLVNSALPVKNVKELIELSKKNPNGLSYGSAGGMGQFPTHVSPELFKMKYGLVANNIPYRGAGLALIDLAAGRVDFAMSTGLVAAQPFLDSGKVRAIAVTGKQRLANMPTVPTFLELGYPLPELDEGVMFALFGPANLPPDIVAYLSNATLKAFHTTEMTDGLKALGLSTAKNPGPKSHAQMMKTEISTWTPIAKKMTLTE
jgi:tripartite-type tricarboxylate transporter receptor subunit TctC